MSFSGWTMQLRCELLSQELAQARNHEMPGQDVIDAAFERVPPQLRRTRRSQEYHRSRDTNAPDPFDEISPIAIGQSELCGDHGPCPRRVEQINCLPDVGRPVHNQSARFEVLRNGGFRAPVGYENYGSCSSGGLHRLSYAPGSTLSPPTFDWT